LYVYSINLKHINNMSRKELVAAATAAGIKKANNIKSTELEKLISKTKTVTMESVTQGGRRGRPVVTGSVRQSRLAARAERAAMNGGIVKRGRPAVKKDEAVTA
jgi:hypothetical protein